MLVPIRPRNASVSLLTHVPSPYLLLPRTRLRHRKLSTSSVLTTSQRRSQDFNSGFTSSYDPTQEAGRGPMFGKINFGVPQFYPRDLKKRVDDYVVGQERAKKTICSVIFNHYQRLRRRQYFELQDQRMREKLERQQFSRDRDFHDRTSYHDSYSRAIEDEYTASYEPTRPPGPVDLAKNFYVSEESQQNVKIDKSNLLLIGPTGVGKTYILETLSKQLNVPFTISDCNSFTQAGYIGQDVETCIERLFIEANHDVKAAEHGIVVLDEFDKIARRETINGRDVGGEGVQQALLKLVEGTKVTINVKENRSSRSGNPVTNNYGSSQGPNQSGSPSARSDSQFTIDTSNILFVFCGAFVGLDKVVLKRVSKPSIGFGSELRSGWGSAGSSLSGSKDALPREMYSHLPHQPAPSGVAGSDPTDPGGFTPLDLTTPADLQTFGFIPELIGRVHNICALTPLSLDELYRILTEPRNSLVAQYTALFETYPSKLFFTRRALYAIAERAARNETGARGLKMEMECVLAEPMFNSPTPYVLITEACVRGTEKAGYWGKDGLLEVEQRLREEDEKDTLSAAGTAGEEMTFEQFREAGQSGA
ncbi:hypothetical protein VTK73DRAFT_124 [Phialemonium thermophilum]|uniref:Uncharacterized protein n=1 Tax=Phialemonium thermophilum TaxID=223376 RepID=A0ABR3Y4U7_9PEZI